MNDGVVQCVSTSEGVNLSYMEGCGRLQNCGGSGCAPCLVTPSSVAVLLVEGAGPFPVEGIVRDSRTWSSCMCRSLNALNTCIWEGLVLARHRVEV